MLTYKMRGPNQTPCLGMFLKSVVLCALLLPQEPNRHPRPPCLGGEKMDLSLSRWEREAGRGERAFQSHHQLSSHH